MARRPPAPAELTPEVRSSDVAEPPAFLLVAGDGLLATHILGVGEIAIGRAAACDVRIDHPALSRHHAVLRVGTPTTIQDLGSTNGTRIAGAIRRGGAPHPLRTDDSFHIGPFSFVLVSGAGRRGSGSQSDPEPFRVVDPAPSAVTPLIRDVAVAPTNVLILGETGVGKEVLAETLHQLSARPGQLLRINCAALSENLLESELFGHERGAFTGAATRKSGLLEIAEHGTVFLDEVGELPLTIQAKLLRAIERREVLPIGAVQSVEIDVRFVAATNRDLATEIEAGRFRRDLYFRLDGVTLVVPPLRERPRMIAPLAFAFLDGLSRRDGGAKRLTADALVALEAYPWPGNVRELRAVIERAWLLARSEEIRPRHLAFARATEPRMSPPVQVTDPALAGLCAEQLAERERIVAVLDACVGNQTRAARRLGIPRTTLANRIIVLRIPRPRG